MYTEDPRGYMIYTRFQKEIHECVYPSLKSWLIRMQNTEKFTRISASRGFLKFKRVPQVVHTQQRVTRNSSPK